MALTRELVAMRAAKELEDGTCVNLGIGVPTLVANFIPEGKEILLESENGVLGVGRIAEESEWDPDQVNAGGNPITLVPGGCFFDSALSFAMFRGGHIDVTILGAFQVSEKGDLANWQTPGQKGGGVGGAMDLAVGAKKVIVLMEHVTRSGEPRIVKECIYPLTARGTVKTIITDLALIEVTPQGLVLKEVAPGVTAEEVQAATEPKLIVSPYLKEIEL